MCKFNRLMAENKYIEQPQKGDYCCDGCIFKRQKIEYKQVKDPSDAKKKTIIEERPNKWGCTAPEEEPFYSCMERKVIFTHVPNF